MLWHGPMCDVDVTGPSVHSTDRKLPHANVSGTSHTHTPSRQAHSTSRSVDFVVVVVVVVDVDVECSDARKARVTPTEAAVPATAQGQPSSHASSSC